MGKSTEDRKLVIRGREISDAENRTDTQSDKATWQTEKDIYLLQIVRALAVEST
jgi:hypothetical protein